MQLRRLIGSYGQNILEFMEHHKAVLYDCDELGIVFERLWVVLVLLDLRLIESVFKRHAWRSHLGVGRFLGLWHFIEEMWRLLLLSDLGEIGV